MTVNGSQEVVDHLRPVQMTSTEPTDETCPEPAKGTCPEPAEGTSPELVEGSIEHFAPVAVRCFDTVFRQIHSNSKSRTGYDSREPLKEDPSVP